MFLLLVKTEINTSCLHGEEGGGTWTAGVGWHRSNFALPLKSMGVLLKDKAASHASGDFLGVFALSISPGCG